VKLKIRKIAPNLKDKRRLLEELFSLTMPGTYSSKGFQQELQMWSTTRVI